MKESDFPEIQNEDAIAALAELKKKIALGYNHDLRDLYTLILKSFNKINKTNLISIYSYFISIAKTFKA